MPTLNAAPYLARSLAPLVRPVSDGLVREVIIADGGSTDETRVIADGVGATVVESARGRGVQLIAGAAAARSPWILFLHADTALDDGWGEEAARFTARTENCERAGAFRFAFDDHALAARRAEWWVGLRNGLFKLPYGDQGLLISRVFYDALGGYSALPLMEDVDLVRRIGARRLALLRTRAVTSADKYRRDGYGARSRRNLWLLARYLMGADPADLAKAYD
jgi:rSAM/selenodomain-associated transferase 2